MQDSVADGTLARVVSLMLVGAVALGWFPVRAAMRRVRRRAARGQPFADAWCEILERNVCLYRHLPPAMKEALHGHILVFLDEKRFEGCDGLEITDEIRLTVAAEACMLLLRGGRGPTYFPRLHTILVYPHPYAATTQKAMGGAVVEERTFRAGESWNRGDLVLAWDSVKSGSQIGTDGQNVVLHEFAHQLDQEDGAADGLPILDASSRYASWARVLSKEFGELKRDIAGHRRHVLDDYGATDPAEFFAVATEAFFEKPRSLAKRDPDLYAELKDYYQLDPLAWGVGGVSGGRGAADGHRAAWS